MEFLIFLIAGGAYLFLSGSKSEQPIRNEPLKVQKAVIKLPEHDPLKELLDLNKDFFDGLLNYPLTHDQRVSILDSGKRNLVLASAGCGKTSVLIAKLAYLHIQEGVPLNKILLLAFNSSVRKELQERLNQIGVADAEIHTFHSFGLNVLKHHSENVMLDKNSGEDTSGVISTNFVRRLISESLPQHPDLFRKVLEFRALCRHHSIYKLANSMQEYNELMQSFPYKRSRTRINDDNRYVTLPALGGRYNVKSQQELLIANWLILNGIEHKYEAVFNKVDYKYTPDFYIPEANLWIEHFAIDRDGSSPFEGYVDDANQKKELHQSLNSNLECTYSYEYYEDTIIDKLKSIMKKNDVPLKPLSDKQVQNLLDVMEVDTFFRYIAEMLRLIKANIISVNEIPEKLSNLEDKFRANRFKEIIVPIFNSYENYLSKEKTIDFEDMILKAVNLLKTNENNEFKYSHILVDEFQDLSMARKNLLKSLLDLDDGELFGVGDDWQSINRFTGADVSLTLDFDTYFEYKFFKKRQSDAEESEFPAYDLTFQPPKIFSVAQTHRCSKNISNIASDFITMNPYQWSKDIESKQTRNPKIKFQTMDEYKTKHVITLINRIPKPNTTESIFVLYPYNRISKLIDFDKVNESFSNFSIQNGTIHSAKGLEADHVILLGMDQGPWGFPMLLGEDPLRDAFLPDSDNYEYSEERRVFYVAMTRAKFNLIICNDMNKGVKSRFVDEALRIASINSIPHEILPLITDSFKRVGKCPKCEERRLPGMLLIKTKNPKNHNPRGYGKKFNVFLGCSSFFRNREAFDFCDYSDFDSPVPCPNCLKNANEGELSIAFHDDAPKVRLECNVCKEFHNYYDFHK